jgi:hypothetical protein
MDKTRKIKNQNLKLKVSLIEQSLKRLYIDDLLISSYL